MCVSLRGFLENVELHDYEKKRGMYVGRKYLFIWNVSFLFYPVDYKV